jgi:hypothetical protein
MFTANSMNCLREALGMSLPGSGSVLAVDKKRDEFYRAAAFRLMDLIRRDIKPRDIATRDAFDNALALDMAMGGSTNTILHALAVAHEAGVSLGLARIDAISRMTPTLCKVAPSSSYHMEDVDRAAPRSATSPPRRPRGGDRPGPEWRPDPAGHPAAEAGTGGVGRRTARTACKMAAPPKGEGGRLHRKIRLHGRQRQHRRDPEVVAHGGERRTR